MTLGDRLKALRLDNDLTMEELRDRLNNLCNCYMIVDINLFFLLLIRFLIRFKYKNRETRN